VQVTARVMCGHAASSISHNVVLPPPDGAEIRISSGGADFFSVVAFGS
jgi:hypothetical protein